VCPTFFQYKRGKPPTTGETWSKRAEGACYFGGIFIRNLFRAYYASSPTKVIYKSASLEIHSIDKATSKTAKYYSDKDYQWIWESSSGTSHNNKFPVYTNIHYKEWDNCYPLSDSFFGSFTDNGGTTYTWEKGPGDWDSPTP
jgi:hypothetical protein